MAKGSPLHPLQTPGDTWKSRTMSGFKVLGPLGLIAVLSWQAQTALVALVLIVALAGISFLRRSQGELWSFLHHTSIIKWGSFEIVMKHDEDGDKEAEDDSGTPSETKKS